MKLRIQTTPERFRLALPHINRMVGCFNRAKFRRNRRGTMLCVNITGEMTGPNGCWVEFEFAKRSPWLHVLQVDQRGRVQQERMTFYRFHDFPKVLRKLKT